MPSMPPPARRDQDESHTEEVVLGVDTHKEVHTAAVITVLGRCWAARCSRRPPPGTGSWRTGRARSGHCSVPGWSAPVLMVRRWPGTCTARASR